MFVGVIQVNNNKAPATPCRGGTGPLTFRGIFRVSLVSKYVIKFKIKLFYQVSYPLVSGRLIVQFLYLSGLLSYFKLQNCVFFSKKATYMRKILSSVILETRSLKFFIFFHFFNLHHNIMENFSKNQYFHY